MNLNQLSRKLEKARRDLLVYEHQWGETTGKKTLAWIYQNFENEGYRDNVSIPWKKLKKPRTGKKLQQSHKLKNSIKMQPQNGGFKIYTRSKYAQVHNQGFSGKVQVRAHQRRKKLSGKIADTKGNSYSYGASSSIRSKRRLADKPVFNTQQVSAHTRNMKIPRRQFMPDNKRGSKMLLNDIKVQTEKDIMKILRHIT